MRRSLIGRNFVKMPGTVGKKNAKMILKVTAIEMAKKPK